MLTQGEASADVKVEPLPLDIYQDLPDIGEHRQQIMEMIAKMHPEVVYAEQATIRHNRRAEYKSIHFLRTESKRKWAYDVKVAKGEYTTDKLVRVAPQQRRTLQAV
jgi:hypothetical protein